MNFLISYIRYYRVGNSMPMSCETLSINRVGISMPMSCEIYSSIEAWTSKGYLSM
jgi:hypothetical protein